MSEPITEDWLRSVGFKWFQLERQPTKHWLLWLDQDDLGIEVASGAWNQDRHDNEDWYCWLRSDTAGRYHRFIHIRHIRMQGEVQWLVAGLTGYPWNPGQHICGSWHEPKEAERLRKEYDRLDLQFRRKESPWLGIEKDEDRSKALPEHQQAAVDSGKAK